ncbi:MAG: Gfo/Idh/MocA family oxidoreductase [Planctomycetota bacterium]|jgi:predicted dehydrogenase|nr:Gfo/Idh/MocA family oxidoreductase [Planctomycetota bacterium]
MTLGWGILGCGSIAESFASQLATVPDAGHLAAVASRSAERAAAFAARHGGTDCQSYQALLDDPSVDVVYIALPNDLHAQWSQRTAEAGKHVLCEKPACMDAAELATTLAACEANDVLFMEAFMYRCHPRWQRLRSMLDDGEVGALRLLELRFGIQLPNEPNIRQHRAHGGGALMDLGAYGVSLARLICAEEPCAVHALAAIEPGSVDQFGAAMLQFPSGCIAQISFGYHSPLPWTAAIHGSTGRIDISDPWCFCGTPDFIATTHGDEIETCERIDDQLGNYAREARHLAAAITAGQRECAAMTWADSRGQAATMDALRAAIGLHWDASTPVEQHA